MKTVCRRLRRGEDLLLQIRRLAAEEGIRAGVVLSAVGCLSRLRLRDASGVTIQERSEDVEIVSLTGTVSAKRCHLHISCSRKDLSTLGGHLVEGCIVNTTCELVIGVLDGWRYETEQDEETGYEEIVFIKEADANPAPGFDDAQRGRNMP